MARLSKQKKTDNIHRVDVGFDFSFSSRTVGTFRLSSVFCCSALRRPLQTVDCFAISFLCRSISCYCLCLCASCEPIPERRGGLEYAVARWRRFINSIGIEMGDVPCERIKSKSHGTWSRIRSITFVCIRSLKDETTYCLGANKN